VPVTIIAQRHRADRLNGSVAPHIPFFWPVLVELNGGFYMGADDAGFGMSTKDMKI
jgi:hypothetical protein